MGGTNVSEEELKLEVDRLLENLARRRWNRKTARKRIVDLIYDLSTKMG